MPEIKILKRYKAAEDIFKALVDSFGLDIDIASNFLNSIPDSKLEPVHAEVLYNVAIEKEVCNGYKKRKALVLQKYTCKSCYAEIPGESKFCLECGSKLDWGDKLGV